MAPRPQTKEEQLTEAVFAGDSELRTLAERYVDAQSQLQRKGLAYMGVMPDKTVVHPELPFERGLEKLRAMFTNKEPGFKDDFDSGKGKKAGMEDLRYGEILGRYGEILGSSFLNGITSAERIIVERFNALPEGRRLELARLEKAGLKASNMFLERLDRRLNDMAEERWSRENHSALREKVTDEARASLRSEQQSYSREELLARAQKEYDKLQAAYLKDFSANAKAVLHKQVDAQSEQKALADVHAAMAPIRDRLRSDYDKAYAGLEVKRKLCRTCRDYKTYITESRKDENFGAIALAEVEAQDFLDKAYFRALVDNKNPYHAQAIKMCFEEELGVHAEHNLPHPTRWQDKIREMQEGERREEDRPRSGAPADPVIGKALAQAADPAHMPATPEGYRPPAPGMANAPVPSHSVIGKA